MSPQPKKTKAIHTLQSLSNQNNFEILGSKYAFRTKPELNSNINCNVYPNLTHISSLSQTWVDKCFVLSESLKFKMQKNNDTNIYI